MLTQIDIPDIEVREIPNWIGGGRSKVAVNEYESTEKSKLAEKQSGERREDDVCLFLPRPTGRVTCSDRIQSSQSPLVPSDYRTVTLSAGSLLESLRRR